MTVFDFYNMLPAFMLVLFRIGGLMLAAPIFSSSTMPVRVKAFLSVAISLAVFPVIMDKIPAGVTLEAMVVGMLGELAVGVFTGFGVSLLFVGVQVGMQFASQQAGLGLANTFNPMMGAQMSTVAQLYYFVSMLLFLAVGGHRALVRTLLDSFESIPPLGFQISERLVGLLFDMMSLSFALAIRVGGPVMLALMLAFLTLGFVSRTVPQLNILSVGFPMKLMVALLTLAITITAMEDVLLSAFTEFLDMTRAGLGLNAM